MVPLIPVVRRWCDGGFERGAAPALRARRYAAETKTSLNGSVKLSSRRLTALRVIFGQNNLR
jgi:hypothetical protein